LKLLPIDLERHYEEMRRLPGPFRVTELGRVAFEEAEYPVMAIHRDGAQATRRMLVVAGIHGNETAGLHAIPRIVDRIAGGGQGYETWNLTIITPANPVGVVNGSRYNGDGCDINRDFDASKTFEARLIRNAIERWPPDLIVSLHEGPQNGFMLIVTSAGSSALGAHVVGSVAEAKIGLAQGHFAGFSLGQPGLSVEGAGTDFLKWLVRLHTLGRYAAKRRIGTYTAESDWSSSDFEERIRAQVVAVDALLSASDGE
jgi:hypothetical protein